MVIQQLRLTGHGGSTRPRDGKSAHAGAAAGDTWRCSTQQHAARQHLCNRITSGMGLPWLTAL